MSSDLVTSLHFVVIATDVQTIVQLYHGPGCELTRSRFALAPPVSTAQHSTTRATRRSRGAVTYCNISMCKGRHFVNCPLLGNILLHFDSHYHSILIKREARPQLLQGVMGVIENHFQQPMTSEIYVIFLRPVSASSMLLQKVQRPLLHAKYLSYVV